MDNIRNVLGLLLLSAACSEDASRAGPVGHGPAGGVSSILSTHPAGTIVASPPLSGRPFGLDISSGDVVYITLADSARLKPVNLPSFAFVGSVAVGPVPTAVAFHPSGNTAWVTNQTPGHQTSTVGVITVASNTQADTIPLAGNAAVVAVNPDGRTFYVSSTNGNVYAIDAVRDTIVGTLALGGTFTNGLAFHPDSIRLYASQISGGTVKEIDTRTNTVTRTFSIGGSKLQGVAVSKDGTELYVADEDANVLRVVKIASGAQDTTVALGGGGFGVAVSRDNAQVYVSLPAGHVVKVIDRVPRAVVQTIQTGGTPRRLGFSVAGETAVIADESGFVHFVR